MHLWIGGDLVPTKENSALFAAGDTQALFGEEFLSLWKDADARILNLETVLADEGTPITKAGPNLRADTACAAALQKLDLTAVCLANNHIFDFGPEGLESTQAALENTPHFGAGSNLHEASQALWLGDTAVYACAEREFSAAGESTPGANPFDPLTSFDHVEALAKKAQRVIVLYHGGLEKYRYPTPNLQRICRKFAEKGASLVICQHSHTVGCMEMYAGGTIIYGQGNLLFTRYRDEHWRTGLLIGVDTETMELSFVPLEQTECGVRVSQDENILAGFRARSQEILQPGFVENAFRQRARQADYEKKFFGRLGRYVRKLKMTERLMDRRSAAGVINLFECDTHRELAAEMLRLKYVDR